MTDGPRNMQEPQSSVVVRNVPVQNVPVQNVVVKNVVVQNVVVKNALVRNVLVRNVANAVSILGVLPLCILFWEQGYQYLLPLIVYNNIMDDLDGILAIKLDIKSGFGARLDNVCDTVSHAVFVFVVGMHYFQQSESLLMGIGCVAGGLLATTAIVLRSVTRLDPDAPTGTGSPTNELIRHTFFVIIVSQIFDFDPTAFLIATFLMHTLTMLVPFSMPYLIRSLTRSASTIGLVNVSLVVAWMAPYLAPVIGAAFVGTYFLSVVTGGTGWRRRTASRISAVVDA